MGASIGLDRLIVGLTELGKLESKGSYLDAEIFCMDKNLVVLYQISVEEAAKKILTA